MTQLFANNAFSTLAGAISNTATTMSVQAGAGAKFPSPTGGDYFLVTLFQLIGGIESNHEVVKVTARSVDTFTIVRAQEGTTARAWGVGDQVSHRSTAGSLGALAQLGASGQAFTQPVAVPTASPGTNTTIAASTEFVTAAIVQAKSDLTAGSPSALDTLNELAAALGNDANFSATTATALGNRLRVDVNTQGLNSTQKANAVTNLGLATVATSGAKADVGLGNVDNTSDANKPVSTATQTALDLKAPLASPTFTGTVTMSGTTLTYSAVGARVTADFSNGTLASRMMFKTSTANSFTSLGAVPDGSGTSSRFDFFNGSDTTNVSYLSTGANNTVAFLNSNNVGTGTLLPIAFQLNGAEAARLDTSSNFGLGQTSPSKYSHGGSARVLEVLNTDTASNSQSHLILSSGCTGASSAIGTVSFGMPSVSNSNKIVAYIAAVTDSSHTSASPSSTLRFATRTAGGSLVENMVLDGSGNLLVGTTTVRARATISGGSGVGLSVTGRSSSDVTGDIEINRSSTSTSVAQGCALTFNDSGTPANTWLVQGGAGNFQFFSFAGGSWNEKARFDSSGRFLVGVTSGSSHTIAAGTSQGDYLLNVSGINQGCVTFYSATTFPNAAAAAIKVNSNTTTSRSINAAGTVNASGADYAEYMRKAEGIGTIAKGQIVGVDAHGLLTDKWADAVSFLVKSTDPSYVGGDVWGTEAALGMQRPVEPIFTAPAYEGVDPVLTESAEDDSDEIRAQRQQYADDQQAHDSVVTAARHQFDNLTVPAYQSALAVFEAKLEAARQKVDRIAYCGQVPVNVIGATPGQYVVPARTADDGITAVLVPAADMTLAWYMSAVGIVQNILPDGRANIRVKPV